VNTVSLSQSKDLQATPSKLQQSSEITSTESSSNSNSVEVEQPNGLLNNDGAVRDARLGFLRHILQKIKKQAEQMGFDGTMQISVIEVEPQAENAEIRGNSIERSFPQRVSSLQPNFLANPFNNIQPQQPWNENRINGFGESHIQPMFMQNEIDVRPRTFNMAPPPMMPIPLENPNWQRIEFPRPSMIQPQLPQALPRPLWNSDFYRQQQPQQVITNPRQDSERGEAYGRRFGDLLRDIIANRIQNFQHLASNPLVFEEQQQQKPQLPQQQQVPASQFQAVSLPKQDRTEWPRGGVINFQNDFFPPPNEQNTDDSKKVGDETKKEFVVSGEINNENSASNPQSGPSEPITGDWLISKQNPTEQVKQEPEQVLPVKPIDSNPIIIPITSEPEEKERPKLDIVESWSQVKIEGLKDESKEELPKNSDSTDMQPKSQNFPNAAPFFFQVDDPNQAQQQPHIVT